MRQTHAPGYILFVDYSGRKPTFIDGASGALVEAELFVGVLGASQYVFATCTPSQSEIDWLDAHRKMFDFFGGCAAVTVPDNLRSAVTKPGRNLVINRSYQAFLEHYGVAVVPARPYCPRHKGMVENSVKIAQHEIMAPMRHEVFHSLEDLNRAVAALCEELNTRPFQCFPDSRRDRFLAQDKPALRALPATEYVSVKWMMPQRVPKTYHIKVLDHFYSVPHRYMGRKVEARVTADRIEIYCNKEAIAQHARSAVRGATTTQPEHQTAEHRAQAQRNRNGFLVWGKAVGPHTQHLIETQFKRAVPLQGLTACDAIKNLAYRHGEDVFEQTAGEVHRLGITSPSEIERYLGKARGPRPMRPLACPTPARPSAP